MWDKEFETILRQHLPFLAPDERLAEDSVLRDYGLDSMATIGLLAMLEERYRVRFVDDLLRLEAFATPGVLWGNLATLRAAAA